MDRVVSSFRFVPHKNSIKIILLNFLWTKRIDLKGLEDRRKYFKILNYQFGD